MKMRKALGVLAVFLSLGATEASAQYEVAYTNLGGVNLNHYCSTIHGAGYKSVLIGNTAGDWKCQRTRKPGGGGYGGYQHPISVEHACKLQYGINGLKAKALNWSDPLSWRCMQPYFVRARATEGATIRDHRNPAPVVRDHRSKPVVRDHRN